MSETLTIDKSEKDQKFQEKLALREARLRKEMSSNPTVVTKRKVKVRKKSLSSPTKGEKLPKLSNFEKEIYSLMDTEALLEKNKTIQERTEENLKCYNLQKKEKKFICEVTDAIADYKYRETMELAMSMRSWIPFQATPKSWSKVINSSRMEKMIENIETQYREAIEKEYGKAFKVTSKRIRIYGGTFWNKTPYLACGFFVKYIRPQRKMEDQA